MRKAIEIKVDVRVEKGAKPGFSELRQPGGPLDWIPKEFISQGPPAQSAHGVDDTILTYIFKAPEDNLSSVLRARGS